MAATARHRTQISQVASLSVCLFVCLSVSHPLLVERSKEHESTMHYGGHTAQLDPLSTFGDDTVHNKNTHPTPPNNYQPRQQHRKEAQAAALKLLQCQTMTLMMLPVRQQQKKRTLRAQRCSCCRPCRCCCSCRCRWLLRCVLLLLLVVLRAPRSCLAAGCPSHLSPSASTCQS